MFEPSDAKKVDTGADRTPVATECESTAYLRPLLALPSDVLLKYLLGEVIHGPTAPWIWGHQPPLPDPHAP